MRSGRGAATSGWTPAASSILTSFANAANVEKLVGSGGYSINDVRRAAGQAPIPEPWADEHFMTLNISPMGGGCPKAGRTEGSDDMRKTMWELKQAATPGTLELYIYGGRGG